MLLITFPFLKTIKKTYEWNQIYLSIFKIFWPRMANVGNLPLFLTNYCFLFCKRINYIVIKIRMGQLPVPHRYCVLWYIAQITSFWVLFNAVDAVLMLQGMVFPATFPQSSSHSHINKYMPSTRNLDLSQWCSVPFLFSKIFSHSFVVRVQSRDFDIILHAKVSIFPCKS